MNTITTLPAEIKTSLQSDAASAPWSEIIGVLAGGPAAFTTLAHLMGAEDDGANKFGGAFRMLAQTIVNDGNATQYQFHQAMRRALGDDNAGLYKYTTAAGYCYAAWSDSERVAVIVHLNDGRPGHYPAQSAVKFSALRAALA